MACYLGAGDEAAMTALSDLAVSVVVMTGVRLVYADALHLCWVSGLVPPAPWRVAGIEFGIDRGGKESTSGHEAEPQQ